MPGGRLTSRPSFERSLFLHSLPRDLLDADERKERSSLPYPHIKTRAKFYAEFGWTWRDFQETPDDEINDCVAVWNAAAEAHTAMDARMERKRPERQWFDGLSYMQIRAKLGVSDDLPDDVIDEMIGRDDDDDEE